MSSQTGPINILLGPVHSVNHNYNIKSEVSVLHKSMFYYHFLKHLRLNEDESGVMQLNLQEETNSII